MLLLLHIWLGTEVDPGLEGCDSNHQREDCDFHPKRDPDHDGQPEVLLCLLRGPRVVLLDAGQVLAGCNLGPVAAG